MESDRHRAQMVNLFFYSFCGIALAIGLSIAEAVVNQNVREIVVNGSTSAFLGLVGGAIVWLFVDRLYQAMGGGLRGPDDGLPAIQVFARALGWGILGMFLAIAPGIVFRSPRKLLVGLSGGFVGGFVGGALFDPISMLTSNAHVSRLVSLLGIGVLAGAAIGTIENVLKTGWLQVASGLIAGKQFVLYRKSTVIGSSPTCDIYLFKDVTVQPQHATIDQNGRNFELQDLGGATLVNGVPIARVRLSKNDVIQIGGTTFVFHEKQATAAGTRLQ